MAKINFKDFSFLQSVEGGKTWGDVKKEAYLTSNKNADFFNNLVASPTEIVGDNIVYEYGAYVSNEIFDNTAIAADDPIVSKQVYQMPTEWLSYKYSLDNRAVKEAQEWGTYLSQTDSKINDQINNINNLTIYQAIVDYCYATGAIRVLDNLTNFSATKDQKITDLKNIASVCDTLSTTQTEYNLGVNPERLITLLSPLAFRESSFSFTVMNGSDNAFADAKNGEFALFGGYQFKKCVQLGQNFTNIKSYDGKGYDFSEIIGMTYCLDSLGVYLFAPIWDTVPNGLQSYTRSVVWKMLSVVKPSMEHLNMIYLATAPADETKINAYRAKLLKQQPAAYVKLPGGDANQITSTEFNAMKTNFKAYTKSNTLNIGEKVESVAVDGAVGKKAK